MTAAAYRRLTAQGCSGEPFDRHVFACVIAVVRGDPASVPDVALTHALGLTPDALSDLFDRYFPHARDLMSGADEGHLSADASGAVEEPDLRTLLRRHGAAGTDEEAWLAAIIARRSAIGTNHLWQDLGLRDRGDLSALMQRYFPALVAANNADMKWKKFFYRTLCQEEGVVICKSPNCETCTDFTTCFGPETGTPLIFAAQGGAVQP